MKKIYKSAKILIVDGDDNVLVLRRSSTHPWSALSPDLPGGIVEPDEELAIGATREVMEETGLVIRPDQLMKLYEMKDIKFQDAIINRIIYGVKLTDVKPGVTISWEHDHFRWMKIEDITGIEASNQVGIQYIIDHNLLKTL